METNWVAVRIPKKAFAWTHCSPIFFFSAKPFMGTRRIENGVAKEYVWQNHVEVRQRIENYGKGLNKLGLTRQKALGIYAVNKPEWVR